MIRIQKKLIAGLIVCAACALPAQSDGNDVMYTVTDLLTLGGPTSVPNAISQNGIIVGGAEVPQRGNYPFIYQGSGPMQNLGLLDPVNGVTGNALSVNSQGQVVGQADAAVGNARVAHAFYYSGSGALVDLTPSSQQSVAWCINQSSQIVGGMQNASGTNDGMLWTIGGPTVDLGSAFLPRAINDEGEMGGLATQTQHAAIYSLSSGWITDLGTFGGAKSFIEAISDTGLAVGFADTPTTSHAFPYNTNTGVLTDLGTLGSPSWYSTAAGVNDLGQVVGGSDIDAAGDGAAFIYTQAGGMQNLNDLIDPSSGWNLDGGAIAINDAGQIVGAGINPQGEFHAFLLTPVVPEPCSFSLLCGAIVSLIAIYGGKNLSRLRFFATNVFARCNALIGCAGIDRNPFYGGVRLLIAACAICGLGAQARGSDIMYTVTDLGTLGGPTSDANAISENGIIVGGAEVPQRGNYPFVYQGNGPMQNLGLLDPVNGVTGNARSVNSQGQVVGQADAAVGNRTDGGHAFYYSGSGSLVDLGTLGGQSSNALGINDSGQIAGYAQTASGAVHGALWTVGGATIDLGAGFLATAINNSGLIGGVAAQSQSAAIYNISSGSVTNLGAMTGGTMSQLNGMSNGFAVGFAESGTATYGFLYDIKTCALTDLVNPVSPSLYSNAAGVNDLGQVVGGYLIDAAGDGAAFIYTQAGGMENLNNLIDPSLGWDLTGCGGINDAGQIVGSGFNPQGEFHAFLLTPVVPEPSTLSLLCGAIMGFLGIRCGARLMKRRRHDNTSVVRFDQFKA